MISSHCAFFLRSDSDRSEPAAREEDPHRKPSLDASSLPGP